MNRRVRTFICLFLLAAILLYGSDRGFAASKYPTGPVKIMVPAAAGGSLGLETRAIAPFLEKILGIPVPIEYVAGAEGMIAYNKFSSEKPDGSVILNFNLSSAISLELTRSAAKYSVKSFSPIAGWNVKNHVIVVHPEGWKSFADFLTEARKRPVAIAAVGGSAHFQGYLMESVLGLKVNWVPYTSAGEGMAAVAGKHAEALITFSVSAMPMVRGGKLRPLIVFSMEQDAIFPDAPTFKGLKLAEPVPLLMIYGVMMAPPGTPGDITSTLENAIRSVTANPEFRAVAEKSGIGVHFRSSSELHRLVGEQYDVLNRYKQFIK